MANKKISDLPAAGPITDDDLLESEQPAEVAGTRSRKNTLSVILTWILSKTHAMTAAINEAKGVDLASAATTDLGAVVGNLVHVTGTTTITALGTVQAGTRRRVIFDGILTLTHNATSLILPTGADITTAAGDSAEFVSEGSGNWRCADYQRADGTPLAGGGGGGGALEKIEEVIVVSPQTDIDFSLLDLDTNKNYIIELYVVPNATGSHSVYLYFNGDTVAANYRRQVIYGSGSGAGSAGANDALIVYTDAMTTTNIPFTASIDIKKIAGVRPVSISKGNSVSTTNVIGLFLLGVTWNNTSNVTSIKLRDSVANGFGIGTYARLYRVT